MFIRTLILLVLFATPLFSQTAENVLLVLNQASPLSIDVGAYYANKRNIPQTHILRIKTTADDTISREDFDRQINAPIAAWLIRNFAQDRILYIVLTKGIPLRIAGTSGQNGTTASVDSELTLLYRRMAGETISPAGPFKNPYFLGEQSIFQAKQFSHADHDIYLVSRLDGYNLDNIKTLIDRGFAPSRKGKILLDARSAPSEKGNQGNLWLQAAADQLSKMGLADRVIFENSDTILTGNKEVLGYYSWGSNDPAIQTRQLGFEFVPGALAGMFVGADGQSFTESAKEWSLATADSPQSQAADFIRDGISGIAAQVSEPFLEASIRPNILYPAYLSGFNLVESYYLSMPFLSWQTVIVGDPLCAPFRTKLLTPGEIDRGLDLYTELPIDFSMRRLKILAANAYKQAGVHPDTTKLILRSEARLARQDRAGAQKTLEEVIARDDRLQAPQLVLAGLYEAAQEYDKAIERYRRLLELAPNNPLILNNLAFALAVRKNNVPEALPLAEKAYGLAKENPSISDTLGWIYHLAGQNKKAIELLGKAVQGQSQNAEMHLHFAIVSSEIGDMLAAEIALKRALEINPKLEQSEEVQQLRSKIK